MNTEGIYNSAISVNELKVGGKEKGRVRNKKMKKTKQINRFEYICVSDQQV
jgi:hypothetical protein